MTGEPVRKRGVAERYQELQEERNEVERALHQAEGALAELRKRIAKEFGVKSDREVASLQKKLDAEVEQTEKEFWEKESRLEEKSGNRNGE